ncbi:hypothetical protein BU17DRAFT_51204 [Hysterangium stoloniferum]|nr:hypothetical protein BU17DRAFT_51204 [Hysterangium stoloniferum]
MLPKVATHILQHTTRVAAAVQNQTTQAFRNALQLQQGTPSASAGGGSGLTQWGGVGSSSGWGSGSSAGPGGAKYNAGSRFYTGYTGPGRSVTQTTSQTDDNDERTTQVRIKHVPTHAKRHVPARPRSLSVSFSSEDRLSRGKGLGVLQVVQARARHAFAAQRGSSPLIDESSNELLIPDQPALVRRNSTSTPSAPSIDEGTVSSAPPPPPSPKNTTSTPPLSDVAGRDDAPIRIDDTVLLNHDLAAYEGLRAAANSKDIDLIRKEIERYRNQTYVSVPCYNMALTALYDVRSPGDPITTIIELYNEMIYRDLIPNFRTYRIMISTLCERDYDVSCVIRRLEDKIKRRKFTDPENPSLNEADEQRLAQLRVEKNFASAMAMFQAATVVQLQNQKQSRSQILEIKEYNVLLRSCAIHANVDAALRVFAHLERFHNELATPTTYLMLLNVFHAIGDPKGAQRIFDGYKDACQRQKIIFSPKTDQYENQCKYIHVQIWNKMIGIYLNCGEVEKAIDLFDSMIATPRGIDFQPTDPPLANTLTYSALISGFCDSGDTETAVRWLEQLLSQGSPPPDWHRPLQRPPLPITAHWHAVLAALAHNGAVDELNRVWKLHLTAMPKRGVVKAIDRKMVARVNLDAIRAAHEDPARVLALSNFLANDVLKSDDPEFSLYTQSGDAKAILHKLVDLLIEIRHLDTIAAVVEQVILREREVVGDYEVTQAWDGHDTLSKMNTLRGIVKSTAGAVVHCSTPENILPLKLLLRVLGIGRLVTMGPPAAFGPAIVASYLQAKRSGDLVLSSEEQGILVEAFVAIELPPLERSRNENAIAQSDAWKPPDYNYPGMASLLEDLALTPFSMESLPLKTQRKVMRTLVYTHGRERALEIVRGLGNQFSNLLNMHGISLDRSTSAQFGQMPEEAAEHFLDNHKGRAKIDTFHTKFVDEWHPYNPKVTCLMGYKRFIGGAKKGIFTSPECIGRLIGGLGRLGNLEKVHELYQYGQIALGSLENQKAWQSSGWFVLEDYMIIGLAHGGQLQAADVHRMRILEAGGTPSADAYAALICNLKDTTDDTGNALQYWEEALSRGCSPNIFMYNTIISRLAKARKAEQALAVFRQMQENGIQPSTITYGAIITAACRVSDAAAAEAYFEQMTASPKYKLRAAPYNMMMQMYVTTKPNRERALYYYNALERDKVKPTDHTWKLLLDIYGKLSPPDIEGMQMVFEKIASNPEIEIIGSHWASLINAHGCIAKDLNRAIGLFESIATHPSTARSKNPMPDAVVYEALFEVFSVHRRPDLIPVYMHRLTTSEVRPTAYVANAVIKGYSVVGDIDSARAMFESLQDPPTGIAAPFNHCTTKGGVRQYQKASDDPSANVIYREPSTWEAMVRAELAVGNNDQAQNLVRRMEMRYVYVLPNNIRVMLTSDDLDCIQISLYNVYEISSTPLRSWPHSRLSTGATIHKHPHRPPHQIQAQVDVIHDPFARCCSTFVLYIYSATV